MRDVIISCCSVFGSFGLGCGCDRGGHETSDCYRGFMGISNWFLCILYQCAAVLLDHVTQHHRCIWIMVEMDRAADVLLITTSIMCWTSYCRAIYL